MNRELILINSALDSHAEWLGNQLALENYSQLFVEHISVKKLVKSLGGTAIKAAHNAAIYDAVSDALSERDSADIILISNYPQQARLTDGIDEQINDQINDIFELAEFDNRTIAGLIVPHLSKDDSILHIFTEHPVPLTTIDAENVLTQCQQRFNPITLSLLSRGLPIQFVDMSNDHEEIMHEAVESVMQLIIPDDPNRGKVT
jgi:hypothetical protein